MSLAPAVHVLTRSTDLLVHQNKTVESVIDDVLMEAGMIPSIKDLTEHHPVHKYSVQDRETDFNFINRLMEQEGIFYFFQHAQTMK